ncbi:unnamed protein product [Prorocentrum cordatum]|uniref:Peroxisomal membrane protein PEX16 n=1 Tax=Prorocentrum cordatum TaxID=2364126 RepID=A0ABN9XRK7_9DINO|nr:unnamed protein product [Polarella glacialis]
MAARPAEAEGPDDPPWNATPRAARSPCAPRLEVGSARTSSSSLGGGGSLGDWWLEEEAPRAQPRGALRAQVIALDSLDTPEHPEDAAQDPTRAEEAGCQEGGGGGGGGGGDLLRVYPRIFAPWSPHAEHGPVEASPGALARAAPADSGLPKRLALLSAALLEILGDLAWAATAAARTQQTQRGAALLCSWSSSRMASGSLGALGEPVSGRAPSGQ